MRIAAGLWLAGVLSLAELPAATAVPSTNNTSISPEWPQWRGPLSSGVSLTARPPLTWSESKNIRWKISLPGQGHSSPIVSGDSVYLLLATPFGEAKPPVFDTAPGTHDSVPVTHQHRYSVIAIHRRDGRILWQKTVREAFPHEGGHTTGSPASHSAVTDGTYIFANFGSRGLYCLDTHGTLVWQADLGRMNTLHAHGEGSSPVLSGDLLIVNWDHEGDSFLWAFDKRTGRQRWKVPRDEKTTWSTPLVIEYGGKTQVVVSATHRVRSYDVATGESLWECAGLTDNVVSSPVHYQGLVIAGNSYARQAMVAIRLDGARGDLSNTDRVAWRLNRMTPYVSSPLIYDDTLYFLRHNQNILSHLDPLTGQDRGGPVRLDAIRDFIFASPVGANGRIYITARDGVTVVLQHMPRGETHPVLAINRLDDSFSASAALAGRELYLHGEHFLYCLAEE